MVYLAHACRVVSLALLLLLLLTRGVTAQPAERIYTIMLTEAQVQALWQAIQKAPLAREVTDSVAGAVMKQVNEQNVVGVAKPSEGAK